MGKILIILSMAAVLFGADDDVVAVVNGRKVTAGEITKMYAGLPAQVQKAFQNDPKQFLREYAWYAVLEELAVKVGLPEQSPYKEVLAFQRQLTLSNAAHNDAYLKVQVTPEQQKKHYDEHKDRYSESQAKLIYIPFTAETESAAKEKAQKVVQQARGGVDFVKLVKEFSEDATSKEKNGDMGIPIRADNTQVPEIVKNTILALKAGQISDPLRLENGYYVFRVESAGVLPYEKVKDNIYKELKDVGLNQWIAKTKAQSSVQFENEAFFQSIKQQPPQGKTNGQ